MGMLKNTVIFLFLPFLVHANTLPESLDNTLPPQEHHALETDFPKVQTLERSFFDELPSNFLLYFRTGGFGILSLENPIGGPSIGLGLRYREEYFGCGISANATSFVVLPFFSIKGEFLCYLTDSNDSYFTGISIEVGQLYIPSMFGGPSEWKTLYQPELVIGKQFKTFTGKTSFVNIGLAPPILLDNEWSKPMISFNYGIGF